MDDASRDAPTELTHIPGQKPDARGFFDRIKAAVGDDVFERDFSIIIDGERESRAELLTGGKSIGGFWPRGSLPPDTVYWNRLVTNAESTHGILLIEDTSKQWFELLDATFGLDPAFVLEYARGDNTIPSKLDLLHPLVDNEAFSRGIKGMWCVRRGHSEFRPENCEDLEQSAQSSYWRQRMGQTPQERLTSVVACCQLSPCIHLIITERSPYGSLPRSNVLHSHALRMGRVYVPWSLDLSGGEYWHGYWYSLHRDLLSVPRNTNNQTASSNLEFNLLFGVHNATELPQGPDAMDLEIGLRFEMLLWLTTPLPLQRSVSHLSSQLDKARYKAQILPSSDTYLPLLAFRRTLADFRIWIAGAKRDLSRLEKDFERMQHPPQRLIVTAFESLDAELDQTKKDLNEEIQLIIGAVTVQDADLARQQSDRATLLTLLAAIYLPLTLVTGIFGMNIRDLEDAEPRFWWCVIVLVMIVALTLVAYVGFRWWQRGQRSSYEQRRKDNMENGLWLGRGSDPSSDDTKKDSGRARFGTIARLLQAKRKVR